MRQSQNLGTENSRSQSPRSNGRFSPRKVSLASVMTQNRMRTSQSRSGGSDNGMYTNAPNDVKRMVVNSAEYIEKERQYQKLHQALQA